MRKRSDKKEIGLALLAFTVLYCLGMGIRVGFFLRAGKSMICEADALEQHINALIAYGKWFCGILYGLRTEHRLSLPNYSFGIGFGGDFYTGMQYYGVGEPLNLPVFFLPSSAVYYYYQFLILLRPYLAGLSFLFLCHYRQKSGGVRLSFDGMTAGALIYSFSGTVLFIGMWNPFFVIPMITMPLLIRGAEILIGEGRRSPLVLAAFAAGISNFYFFYMQVILLIGWFAIRMVLQKHRPAARLWLAFFSSGALGVLMGGVLLFPMFLALLHNPRSGGHAIPLLYEPEYYRELLRNLAFYVYHPLHDAELGLTVLAFPVLIAVILFAGRWNLRRERIELILLILMLCIPAAGYVMSGFAYAINRWCFAMALLTAWLTAALWDHLISTVSEKRPRMRRLLAGAVLAVVILSVGYNLRSADAPDAGNLPNGFVERMSGSEFLDRMVLTEVNALEQTVLPAPNRFARYSGRNPVWNAALLHGVSSTQFYWSLTNGAIADLFSELSINDLSNFNYLGPEERTAASELMGVTHFTLRYDTPEEQAYVPAGFVRAAEYYNFAIYENPMPVGLGTVYDRILPHSEYMTLAPADREEALLSAAVLEEGDLRAAESAGIALTDASGIPLSSQSPKTTLYLSDDRVTWISSRGEPSDRGTVLADADLEEGGTFLVRGGEGGAVDLLIEPADPSDPPVSLETGLYLEGLFIDAPGDIINIDIMRSGLSALPDDPETAILSDPPQDGSIRRTLSYKTPESEFYSGWHDYLVNLGCSDAPCLKVRIVFPTSGSYTMRSLSAVSRPVDALLSEKREALAAHAVQETDLHKNPVSLMTDTVTCHADGPSDGPGLLMLTIPWQNGWHALVDGGKTPLLRTNTAFTGLILPPGPHEITLRYRTPGLPAGILMSFAGTVGLILILLQERRRSIDPVKSEPEEASHETIR
ncbi:MAG: YfhO family protein [Lachnospiraceae bacterium]|nr:YfhO family protein [Lachnospiraceae bacterium]